jgi:hypothetical protein
MDKSKTFDVLIFTSIPFVTTFLKVILTVLVLFMMLILLPLDLLQSFPPEITVFLLMIIPEKWVVFLVSPFLLFFIFVLLFDFLRIKKRGTITFDREQIIIQARKFYRNYPIRRIVKINCFDRDERSDFSFIIERWDEKTSRVKLLEYSQADEVFEIINQYADIEVNVLTMRAPADFNED